MQFKIVIFSALPSRFYIGGYKTNSGWKWFGILTNEMPLNGDSQSDWHGSEPAANAENCVLLKFNQGWHNVVCSNQFYFACEKEHL